MTGRSLVVLALATALVAGCTDTPATVAPTPTRPPEPTPEMTTYVLGTTVWYEGLQLHFDRAVAALDQRGGPVEVSVRIQNSAAEEAELNAPIRLVVGGLRVEPTRESRVPTVPAGGIVGVLLRYELQGMASVDNAIVQVGEDPLHLGRVPLTPEAGEAVLFEPAPLVLTGTATAGDLRISLRGGELRWDLPDWSQQLDASLQALTLTYDVTFIGDFSGGFAFTGENVALRLPDESVIGPRRDGHSQSVELIGAGKTKDGLSSRFEIPAGMTGQFTLFAVNGSTRTGIAFTIGE